MRVASRVVLKRPLNRLPARCVVYRLADSMLSSAYPLWQPQSCTSLPLYSFYLAILVPRIPIRRRGMIPRRYYNLHPRDLDGSPAERLLLQGVWEDM